MVLRWWWLLFGGIRVAGGQWSAVDFCFFVLNVKSGFFRPIGVMGFIPKGVLDWLLANDRFGQKKIVL